MVNLASDLLPIPKSKSQFAMTKIFGDYINDLPSSHEYLILGFSPSSIPLKQRWRNNGLSADFIADYFTTFFPGSQSSAASLDIKAEVKGAVSFIANELLENAMKFSDESSTYPVSIQLYLSSDRMVFLVTNSVKSEQVEKFQSFIQQLTTLDPSELYILQLEKNASEENEAAESGLGLLTMINDYQAKLGWKFEMVQEQDCAIAVTTMVQLSL
jgi:hypothetical protein